MIKKEKGITLVALVVTIIILLILAGVTITIALSDNGLFKRSKEAVNTYKDKEAAEQNELTNTTKAINELFTEYWPTPAANNI